MNDKHTERPKQEEHFEWKRLLLRKDRPLPKAGCSWAFYIVMAALAIYLIVMFIKYNNS